MPKEVSEGKIMSVFKQKNAIASTEFKGFEGIDSTAPHGYVPAAKDMANFRLANDGSLEKRSGFAPIAVCNEKIRAIWSGKLEGKQSTFIVYGHIVASVDPGDNTLVNIGYVANSGGHTNFIFFNSRLYLMDGTSIYSVDHRGVFSVEGYAPLYGKNWGSAKKGSINEPLNLATRHIRMTYRLTETLTYLCVDHVISSIDAVFINGLPATENNSYYFDQSLMCVCVMGIKAGDYVELFLTVAESEMDRSSLFSCKSSVVYGTYTDNRLFLWDGEAEDLMFASRSVDNESLEKSKSVYGNTVPLYIPVDAAFAMTKDGRKITAVCRHYDRLLIFTNADTWMARSSLESGNPLDAVTINPSRGCSSNGAVAMCGNDPICVSDGSILCWTSDTDELNESNAYSISKKIDPLLGASFFKNAKLLVDESHAEILFIDPYDAAGTMWVYNYNTKNWFKFDGIYADSLFLCDKSVGFVRDNAVYLFDDTYEYDVMADGSEKEIVAFYESLPTDLSVAGNKKRLLGMTLNANMQGSEVLAEYISDGKLIASQNLKSESLYPISFIKRLNSRRFCYLSLRLTCRSGKHQKIFSTSIWAKQ